ncbi:hypothetical protein KA001_00625 [Patescibacteria group bacterium]|nr:hypothetical protein [Patescibacteria group bacterium]
MSIFGAYKLVREKQPEQLNRVVQELNTGFAGKLLLWLIKQKTNVDIVAFSQRIDELSKQGDFDSLYATLLRELNVFINIRGEVPKILSKEAQGSPVLIYGNHQLEAGLVGYPSVTKRQDIKVIVARNAQLFPGIPQKSIGLEPSDKRMVWKLARDPAIKDPKEFNLLKIEESANQVASGGGVVIFPAGSKPISGDWFSGIGKIAKGALEKIPSVNCVPVFFENSNLAELVSRVGLVYPSAGVVNTPLAEHLVYNIRFGESFELSQDFANDKTPEELSSFLRQNYLEQFDITYETH